MIITTQYIQRLELYYRMYFTEELKSILLEKLGEEPFPHTYTEQDLWEQSRKIISTYQSNKE